MLRSSNFFYSKTLLSVKQFSSTIDPTENVVFLLKSKDTIEKGFKILESLPSHQQPYALTKALKSCTIQQAENVFYRIPQNRLNSFMFNSLLSAYCKAGQLEKAEVLYNQFPSTLHDVVTHSTMLKTWMQHRQVEKAEKLLSKVSVQRMDDIFHLSVVNGFVKAGYLEKAEEYLQQVPSAQRNVKILTCLVQGYCTANQMNKAENLLQAIPIPAHDSALYTTLLNGYVKSGAFHSAESLYNAMPSALKDIKVSTIMIGCYLKMNRVVEAKQLFERVPEHTRNSAMYNNMLDLLFKQGLVKEAEEVVRKMPRKLKDEITSTILVHGYSAIGELEKAEAAFNQTKPTAETIKALLHGYCKHGRLEKAEKMFESLPASMLVDAHAYNIMLNGYAKKGMVSQVENLFNSMPVSQKDEVTFTVVVDALIKAGMMNKAEAAFRENPSCSDAAALLVDGYCKLSMLSKAEEVFNLVPTESRTARLGEVLLRDYLHHDKVAEAEQLYKEMPSHCRTDNVHAAMIKYYMENGSLAKAEALAYSIPLRKGACQALLNGYYTLNKLDEAVRLFKSMPSQWRSPVFAGMMLTKRFSQERVDLAEEIFELTLQKDETFYSIMVNGYAKAGLIGKAEALAHSIPLFPKVAHVLLAAYCRLDLLEKARVFFRSLPSQLQNSTISYNTMLNALFKRNLVSEAESLFQRMPTQLQDEITFTTVIDGYASAGMLEKAESIFQSIPWYSGTSNALLDGYWKQGLRAKAQTFFDAIPAERRCAITFNTMLKGYFDHGQVSLAQQLLKQIPQSTRNEETYSILIEGYMKNGELEAAESVFQSLPPLAKPISVMLDRYFRIAQVEKAQALFERIPTSIRGIIHYNTMINGLAINGEAEKALALYKAMSVTPDAITFVSLLNGCSHKGLVEEAEFLIYKEMPRCKVQPSEKHWNSLLDCYSRKGLFDKAQSLLSTNPDVGVTGKMILLAGCRNHNNVQLANQVFADLIKQDPSNSSAYVLMQNILRAAGMAKEADEVRSQMNILGLKKIPGTTTIRLNGGKIELVANDKRYSNDAKLKSYLESHARAFGEAGFKEDVSVATKSFESEEELIENVSLHSERIAIALLDMNTPPGSPMFLENNLRVCKNCHSFAKFISGHLGRTITVRDANRFHKFEYGKCSCGDYW